MTARTTTARPPAARVRTLAEALRAFSRHGSPWLLMGSTLAAAAGLLLVGQWRWAQLAVVLAVVVAQPFVEWLVHLLVLHARPRQLGPVTVDLYQARKHRAHHADPRDLDILLIPLRGHLAGAAAVAVVCLLLPDAATRLALVVAVGAGSLGYEWVHFLIHTDWPEAGRRVSCAAAGPAPASQCPCRRPSPRPPAPGRCRARGVERRQSGRRHARPARSMAPSAVAAAARPRPRRRTWSRMSP